MKTYSMARPKYLVHPLFLQPLFLQRGILIDSPVASTSLDIFDRRGQPDIGFPMESPEMSVGNGNSSFCAELGDLNG